jgi:DNA-binding transcriptional ArsR family regulator
MKYVTAAHLFRGLADPTRVRILNLLRDAELTGTELAAILRLPRARIARHLRYLYRCWLIAPRRDVNETHYSLRPSDHPLQELVRTLVIPELARLDGAAVDTKRLRSARSRG